MICPNCGKELSDSAIMCWRCGRTMPLRPEEAPGYAEQAPSPNGEYWNQPDPSPAAELYTGPEIPPPEKKSPKKLLIGIGIAVAVLAVLAILIGVFVDDTPTAGASQGFETHQELIATYCDYFAAVDDAGMVTLYPQALRDYLAEEGCDDVASFLEDRDVWYDSYGVPIEHWMISNVTEYGQADYAGIASQLGVQIQSAADVEVALWFEDEDDEWLFDFDLVEIDGEWFLISVW